MIYTLTTNPSIDYIMRIEDFAHGATLRSKASEMYPGGKGIMVSKLLKNLGDDPVNIGFLGGFTGDFIKNELEKLGIKENFTEIKEDSRINVKLKYQDETEINAEGPHIEETEVEKFFASLTEVKEDDLLVISGSLPKSLDKDFYKEVIRRISCKFTIDIANKEVLDYLKYKPVLVKPNKEELGRIFETEIETDEDIISYARKLNELGAENVIVSLGGEGSIFVDKDRVLKASPITGKLVNSVGAGDSMVAGFVYGLSHGLSKKDAYKLAVACGTATAFSPDIGSKEKIDEILEKVEVKESGN
ncbi:1-phosphofructokinase [Anaerococcus marasmi]|uniref:1-phosphofructokinase n=1 Tax=Anaerococcus marasmi TaxID=2057797 RepID=UPI000CFA5AA5|nr:1-phosphofructokinase [Anaerococcus marasmi]